MSTDTSVTDVAAKPRWQPLESLERRVLGVLIEKAKTTPENYPLSLNALKSGCNQKNNRSPLMQVEEDQVESALEALRRAGAVAVIQGSGRVDKYRHLAYEWLGVDKVELAVMAELLLRGAQTVGELRGRAARMEPIKDMAELRPVLDALVAKRLVLFLTPEGRGAIVTHTLYQDREMEKVRRDAATSPMHDELLTAEANVSPPQPSARAAVSTETEARLDRLRAEVAALKQDFATIRAELESTAAELRRKLDELNRQLGN
jgi:uncharacterized protein YceH (UPF0502 family)